MRISHEAIYQALFVQGRGVLRRELTACLRTGRALRMPRARTRRRGKPFLSPEIMLHTAPNAGADPSPGGGDALGHVEGAAGLKPLRHMGEQGGFKRWSQHGRCLRIEATDQVSLPAFSNRASFGVGS